MRHRDFDLLHLYDATDIHGEDMLHALRGEPLAQFGNGNHCRCMLLRNFNQITDMVVVAVRGKQQMNLLNVFVLVRAGGIVVRPGVNQKNLALRRRKFEGRMAKPRDLYAIERH